MKTEARPKEPLEPPGPGEAGGTLPWRLRRNSALLMPGFWTSSLQGHEGEFPLFEASELVVIRHGGREIRGSEKGGALSPSCAPCCGPPSPLTGC